MPNLISNYTLEEFNTLLKDSSFLKEDFKSLEENPYKELKDTSIRYLEDLKILTSLKNKEYINPSFNNLYKYIRVSNFNFILNS